MDFINLIESTPRSQSQVEAIPIKDVTDAQRIKQLEKIIDEQRENINKYEQKIGPKLILMIKSYLDKLNSADDEIKEKEEYNLQLQKENAYLKDILAKLKKIWA